MFRRLFLVLCLAALVVPFAAFAARDLVGGPPPPPVGDDDPPTITVPADMTVEAQNFTGATVTYTASARDRRGRPLPVSCAPPSGSIFPLGQTTVTCSATDPENGETASKRFRIRVVDRTPPTLTLPGAKTVRTPAKTGAVVRYKASATDIVDGPVPVVCAPASGTRFPVGLTHVSCSAGDRAGNVASRAFDVNVVFAPVRQARSTALFAPPAGALLSGPPLLRWRAVRRAAYYNVQVFRNGHKVLSNWPGRPQLRLHARWRYLGRPLRLRPGTYTWFVWPWYGKPQTGHFGKLLGRSSFRVA